MGKVSRLFKGELKKIFLGPGIFFMTAFLILLLTIAPKLFNPTTKTDISSSVSISTTNVEAAYSSFIEYKAEYETKLELMEENIQQLINSNENFKEKLVSLANEIYILRSDFDTLTDRGSITQLSDCLSNLIIKTETLISTYNSYMQDYTFPLILVDETLDYDIKFETTQFLKLLNKDGNKSTRDFYTTINESIINRKSTLNIKNYISEVENLSYSSKNLNSILEKYYKSQTGYQQEIIEQIEEHANQASLDEEYNISNSNINSVKELSLAYLSIDNSSTNCLKNSLYLEVSSSKSDAEMSSYIGFEDFNSYKYKEELSKFSYLLENNLSDSNFATAFSFNTNTSKNTNAFDYMYFTMEIASFFIIAFTVILGAGMISKEYSDGTIKLLAIRPYKRNKIILSKILATMFFAFIFVIVSLIVTLITGIIIYGITFPTMLLTFNAAFSFTLPIWVVFLIYVACLMIKIWIFALLAITISTIFKSYIAAVCVSVGIYILNLILTFVSKGANWLKFNVFANLDLFKFFGGSFTSNYSSTENLTNLFLSPVFADTSVWLTGIVIVVMAVLLNIIVFSVFKHKDIT